jgi:hypothetical protein
MNLEESQSTIAHDVAGELFRGVTIIRGLDDENYKLIGAQFRHNLDFVNALLNGLVEQRIDYNARQRDPRVETDAAYAEEQMFFAMRRLERFLPDDLDRLVSVRSEINENRWHTSSVSRELEFLHSHTVHHHALIAKILSSAGVLVSSDLGIAPSTLRFRASLDSAFASS